MSRNENETLTIPYDDLAAAMQMLRRGGAAVDDLKVVVPEMPDAGEFSGAVGAVLAHLLEGAAQVAIGLEAIGDAVGAAIDAYRVGDEDARDRVLKLWTN